MGTNEESFIRVHSSSFVDNSVLHSHEPPRVRNVRDSPSPLARPSPPESAKHEPAARRKAEHSRRLVKPPRRLLRRESRLIRRPRGRTGRTERRVQLRTRFVERSSRSVKLGERLRSRRARHVSLIRSRASRTWHGLPAHGVASERHVEPSEARMNKSEAIFPLTGERT